MSDAMLLTNAKIVLKDAVIEGGSVLVKKGVIADISEMRSQLPNAVDCEGDYLCAGLIELHIDNLERHMSPRPGVNWPQKAAILAHDTELAGVGITTVYDALRVGSIPSNKRAKYEEYAYGASRDLLTLYQEGALRIDHFLHLRAEICCETLLEELEAFSAQDRIGIVSLMDHTPGQKQFRDDSKMRAYLAGKYTMSEADINRHFEHLRALQVKNSATHIKGTLAAAKRFKAILASHDDTTAQDVMDSVQRSVRIAEFPTTQIAAQACHQADIAVLMGAPNLLRGGSHSGNIAAQDLVSQGLLDILSSDYAPASLLMGAVQLGKAYGCMAKGLASVTSKPAQAVDLTDRGQIALGYRADLCRFRLHHGYPVTKAVWSQGKRCA